MASAILGPLALLIVASQSREDAWSILIWTYAVLVPVFLLSYVLTAQSWTSGGVFGVPGMVAISSVLLVAVGSGYRIAALRHDPAEGGVKKSRVPRPPDDEIG